MMEFVVAIDKEIYEISELVTKVSFTDTFNDGCSKLEFSYVNEDLEITNGSTVWFKYDDAEIFYGYVFKVSKDDGKEVSVTAYDQLRYCKAKDTVVIKGETVSNIVGKMCNYFHLKKGTITDTKYTLETSVQDDKTWLDIIYNGISDTLLGTSKWYLLRDEFGSVALRSQADLALDLILGDESLCYGYKYEKSIDDEFYNMIKLVSEDEEAKTAEVTFVKDDDSIGKYGLLQYYEKVDSSSNASKLKTKADALLSLYNKEVETISLDCLGDTRIRAGSSFYGLIEDIALKRGLIVKSVTHDFLPTHTMSLEVMT